MVRLSSLRTIPRPDGLDLEILRQLQHGCKKPYKVWNAVRTDGDVHYARDTIYYNRLPKLVKEGRARRSEEGCYEITDSGNKLLAEMRVEKHPFRIRARRLMIDAPSTVEVGILGTTVEVKGSALYRRLPHECTVDLSPKSLVRTYTGSAE